MAIVLTTLALRHSLCAYITHVDDLAVFTIQRGPRAAVRIAVAAWADLAGQLSDELNRELDGEKQATLASSKLAGKLLIRALGGWCGDGGRVRK